MEQESKHGLAAGANPSMAESKKAKVCLHASKDKMKQKSSCFVVLLLLRRRYFSYHNAGDGLPSRIRVVSLTGISAFSDVESNGNMTCRNVLTVTLNVPVAAWIPGRLVVY